MVVVFVSYLDGGVDTVTAFLRSLGVVTVVSQTGGHTTIQLQRKEIYRNKRFSKNSKKYLAHFLHCHQRFMYW